MMKTYMYSLLPALVNLILFFPLTSNKKQDAAPQKQETCIENSTAATGLKTYNLFSIDNVAARSAELQNAVYLDLNQKQLQELYTDNPHQLQLRVPAGEQELMLDLRENQVLTEDFLARAETASGIANVDYQPGRYYSGYVSGDPNSLVTISVFEGWVMGIISTGRSTYNLGPIDAASKGADAGYVLYKEEDHKNPPTYECYTEDKGINISYDEYMNETGARMTSVVKIYIEADYRMYQDHGNSEQNVIDYVTGLFNELSVMYGNEQILTRISEIKVWTVQDPYPSSSSNAALNSFTNRLGGNFNGDLAHLVSTVPAGNGGVAWLGVLCVRNRACAYSNINNTFNTVPTYSWSVDVITHEMGHNMGSPHTHSCSWGPNQNQALDNCYATEGGCSPGPAPTNGGTVMSYCHLASYGKNLANGFGLEPGNLIRAEVALANCLEDVFDCFTRIPLEAGVTYSGNTAVGGARNFSDYNCMPDGHPGNEIAHSFVGTQPGWAYISYGENEPERLDLLLMSACHPDSCVKAWQGAPTVLDSFFVEFGEEYVFIVDVHEDNPGGAYDLTISFPGSGCATTVSLTDGVTYTASTDVGVSNFIDYNCSGTSQRGKEVGHFFISPVGGNAIITFNDLSGDASMNLILANACHPDSCIQFWSGPNVAANFQIESGQPYYFIVDSEELGSDGDYELTVSIPEANTCVCDDPNDVAICENFESYSPGGLDPQSQCWSHPGLNDGIITNDISSTGTTSMKIDATGMASDFPSSVISLGDRITGIYILKFKMNIEAGASSYWRVYHNYDPNNSANNQVAFEVEMERTLGQDFAKLYAGNPNGSSVTFPFLANSVVWSDIVMIIDITNDNASLLYNGSVIYQWPFSNTRNGSGGLKKLAAINFYAKTDLTFYYVDDVHLYSNEGLYCTDSGGIFCDDFDTYNSGALTQQSLQWIPMTGGGGDEDISVVFTQASSGLNSVLMQSGIAGATFDNVVAQMGDKTTGKYVMQFQMNVKLGSKGAFRVLHEHIPNGTDTQFESAYAGYFLNDGTGVVRAGGTLYPFTYPRDVWFHVVSLIDFGLNQVTVFVDGRTVGTWPFSNTETGSGGTLKLKGLNLLAPDYTFPNDPVGNTFDVLYFVDNVELFDLEKYLNTDPKVLNVEPEAGNISFDIASNTSWTAQESSTWFSINTASGMNNGSVTVNYDENLSIHSRKDIIRVKGVGTPVKRVEVIQAGADPLLEVDPGDQTFGRDAGSFDFDVNANVLWGALSLDTSWLKTIGNAGANGDGPFSITFDKNYGPPRSDSILVTGQPAADVYIVITQDEGGPALDLSTDTIRVPAAMGTVDFELLSNVNWDITENASWFSLNATSGSDFATVTITYDENTSIMEREAVITVSGDNGVPDKTIVVIQDDAPPFLTIDPLVVNLPSAPGGTVNLNLGANVTWDAAETASWFSLSSTNGNGNATLTLTYDENIHPPVRRDTITITGTNGVADLEVIVIQEGADAYMSADPVLFNLTAPAGSVTFDITSNVNWNLIENATWLTLDQNSGSDNATITITYDENFTLDPRSATITLSGNHGVPNVVIQVNQESTPPTLIVDPLTVTVGKDAGNTILTITSNVNWTISDDASWLTADRSLGSGSAVVTLTFNENTNSASRVANITVTGDNGVATVIAVLTQAGLGVTLEASPTDIMIPATSGNVSFDVTANIAWNTMENESWFSLVPPSGFGNGMVRINYQANPSANPRTGTITLKGTGAVDVIITVTQEGAAPQFDASPLTLNVPATMGSTGVDITGNVDWTATSNDSWLSVTPDAGTGISAISVLYEANPLTQPRTGTITLSGDGGVPDVTITVNQAAGQPSIVVAPATINVSAPAGSTTFDVDANVDWTSTVSDTWLSIDPDNGSGDATITINYDENMSPSNRTATINIQAVGSPLGRTVTVIQGSSGSILTVDPLTLNVPKDVGSSMATITSNVAWAASSNAGWLTVMPGSGNGDANLTIEYQENTGPAPRVGTITVSGTGVSDRNIVVTQAGAGAFLTVSTDNFNVAAPAGNVEFDLLSNVNWTITANDPWLSADPSAGADNGTVQIDFQENTGPSTRLGTLTVSGDNGVPDQTITITQEGAAFLTVSQNSFNVSAPSGSVVVGVTANVSWSVSDDATWLSVAPASGSGNGSLTVNYDENMSTMNRSATITVSGTGVSDQVINITQAGISAILTVDRTQVDVTPPAGSTTVGITSNIAWTATENASWFSVTPGSGSGNATLTINYDENSSNMSRTASITVSGAGVANQVINVTQQGNAAFLVVDQSSLNVTAPSGSSQVEVTSNVSWTASSDQTWLTVMPTSGTGDAAITFDYTENTSTQSRVANVTISGTGVAPQTVVVTQAGAMAFLTVNPATLNVSAPAGTANFVVSSNIDWMASADQPWLNVSQTNGSGGATVTINYQQNLSTAGRSATITVSSGGVVPDQTIMVTQAGAMAFLTTNPSSVNVTAPAGTANVAVNSNVSWTVSDNAAWFSVSPASGTGNGGLTITYDENTGSSPRSGTITISPNGLGNQTITVTQAGTVAAFLTVDRNNETVPSTSGSLVYTINSNVSWTVSSNQSWLILAPAAGSGNGVFVASYSPNSMTSTRVATITITGTGVPVQTYTVTQEAFSPVVSVNPLSFNVGPQAGSVMFSITANTPWTLNSSDPWVNTNVTFGNGNATITANYQANPNSTSRSASISITGTGAAPVAVLINQSAFSATVDLEERYDINLFPNPVKEDLVLQMNLPEAMEMKIEVVSITGQILEVLQDGMVGQGARTFEYSAGNLSSGIYLLRVQSEEGFAVKRFVVGR